MATPTIQLDCSPSIASRLGAFRAGPHNLLRTVDVDTGFRWPTIVVCSGGELYLWPLDSGLLKELPR